MKVNNPIHKTPTYIKAQYNKWINESEMTEEDAEKIGNKIKKEIARKHGL